MTLPKPPKEVPVDRDLSKLAPLFKSRIILVVADMRTLGHDAFVFEAARSDDRARFLYGFSREYDDGRGIVTNARTAVGTWHFYCLAVDIISKSKLWGAPPEFWRDLGSVARRYDLTWGGYWKNPDRPHVQWWCPGMRVSPSVSARKLYIRGGVEAVWDVLHAR